MATTRSLKARVASCPKCSWRVRVNDKHAQVRALKEHLATRHSDE
jgi:DNA-directed RNA polymerase subunit RPC12/RpoP